MSEKIPKKTTISIVFIALAGQIAWAVENQYYNVFLYNEIAPVPLFVSLMVAITAVVATVTAIVMGAYSDVKGKRRPFMLIGLLCWIIATVIFPFAAFVKPIIMAVIVAILFDCIMTYFGATAYDAAFNAYVTDVTTLENRGKAIGIVEIMTLISVLIIYGISGFIIIAFGYYFFFFVVGFLVAIFGIPGALLVKDSEDLTPLNMTVLEHLKSTFNKDMIKNNKDFFLVLSGLALWSIAFNVFFQFIIIYLQHYIGLSLEMASTIVFIALLISIIAALPIGIVTDKIGRKRVAICSVFLESIALILFALSNDLISLIITSILWVFFMTMWHISSGTWIKDLYPKEKFGQASGYFIFFNVLIGMTIGSLIGGILASVYGKPIVINGTPGIVPTPIIFWAAGLLILLTIIPLIRVKELKNINNELNNTQN